MLKRLGGIKGCKYKTSSWHLNIYSVLELSIPTTHGSTRRVPYSVSEWSEGVTWRAFFTLGLPGIEKK